MEKKPIDFLPLSQATFYILLSLRETRHGYSIMQDVETVSSGLVKIGPGTLYGALGKLEKQGVIEQIRIDEDARRKYYALTVLGRQVVKLEFERMQTLIENSKRFIDEMEGEE